MRRDAKKKKEVRKLPEASPQVLVVAKPRVKMAAPSPAPELARARSGNEIAKDIEDSAKKTKESQAMIERWRKVMQEVEELRKVDPIRADKLLAKEEKKRLREQDGGASEQSAEKKVKGPQGGAVDVANLKAGFAEALMKKLKPYLLSGRIADRDSFKHLTRKLTKELVKKEQARGNAVWHPKLAAPAEAYADAFMERLKQKNVLVYNMQKQ